VKAVVFDVGETLVDEERTLCAVADQYGWSHADFFAALGAVIERREHHSKVFDVLGASEPPEPVSFEARDFYPDALGALRAAQRKGARVGIAGNTSERVEEFLRTHVDVDFVASSARWGVEKPDPGFFARIVEACGCDAASIMYVGDRIDNDILPAAAAGMQTFFVLRGPWATVQQTWPEASAADASGTSLLSMFSGAW
jgi:HAD superfamily hydrolase (TIGR01662 family)